MANSGRGVMVKNGLIVVLTIVAVVLAVVAFTQFNAQQESAAVARDAQTAQAEVLAAQATSVAQADAAVAAQQTAEAGQGTAVAQVTAAAQAQTDAEAGRETAVALVLEAESALAEQQTAAAAAQVTTAAQTTLLAQTGTAVGGAAATITAQAGELRTIAAALGTATAQVDLADFARLAAEDDRATALEQARAAATLLAQAQATIAAAQPSTAAFVPSLTAPASATPEPTTVTASATSRPPVSVAGVALDQAFVSVDGTVRLNYPAGWMVQESDGQILLVNTLEVLSNTSGQLQPGHFLANILLGRDSDLPGVAPGAGAVEFLTVLAELINARAAAGEQLGAVTATTAGDYEAARTQGQTASGQTLVLVARLGGGVFAVGFATSAPDEINQYEPLFRAILGTIRVSP